MEYATGGQNDRVHGSAALASDLLGLTAATLADYISRLKNLYGFLPI